MRLTFIISLSFLLFACDPGHKTTSTIENNSSKEVILTGQIFGSDKITLEPGESKLIQQSGPGGYNITKASEICPCSDPDLKLVTVDSTLTISKDIKNPDNWIRTSKRKYIKSGVFTCKFTLTNQDIK